MKRLSRLSLWALGLVIGLAVFSKPVHATDPHNLDIHVSISGAKSLSVNTTYYDFGAMAVNTSSVSATDIQVTNTSTVFIETYTITGANAISNTSGTDWTLASSTGPDTFALAAQFSTAMPADLDANWVQDDMTTGSNTCSTTVFGNGTQAQSGSNVGLSALRHLWFRMRTPSSVTDSTQHTITAVLAVL